MFRYFELRPFVMRLVHILTSKRLFTKPIYTGPSHLISTPYSILTGGYVIRESDNEKYPKDSGFNVQPRQEEFSRSGSNNICLDNNNNINYFIEIRSNYLKFLGTYLIQHHTIYCSWSMPHERASTVSTKYSRRRI